jgi:CMP-N,N'-diacetyllegionaminic acid synthase
VKTLLRHIAIIPARSGSKGLKDKNIKPLNGKPLLAYTIQAARVSEMFDEIVVSTDSAEYAEIAKQWGANVPLLRSKELASDTASTWDAIKEVLRYYSSRGRDFDTVAVLQPTSPLRTAQDIIAGYEVYLRKEARAVVAVCEVDHSPLWCNVLPENHSMNQFLNTEWSDKPRQNLQNFYRINGALYIVKAEDCLLSSPLYNEHCYATIMPKERSVDIDDEFDFRIAAALLS